LNHRFSFSVLFVQPKEVIHTVLKMFPLVVVAEDDVEQGHTAIRDVSVNLFSKKDVVNVDAS
jgi:hypothetical protein